MNTEINLIALLDFLYDEFAITFVVCCLGLIIKESTLSVKQRKLISIPRVILGTLFAAIVACALNDKLKLPLATYILFCLVLGIWSKSLLDIITNGKIVGALIKAITIIAFKVPEEKVDEVIDDIVETMEEDDENDSGDDDQDGDDDNSGKD